MKAGSMTAGVVVLAMALGGGPGCSEKRSELANGTPGTNSTLLIEPNIAVGPVRAGMTVAQVIAELGEPQRLPSNSLEYTRLGFAVMPGPEGKVQVVMCGDVTGINGPLVKRFTGRTKEGIGLSSSREDLTRAYGEPTSDEKLRGGAESVRYDLLGITFTLEGGKVYHMIVRLPGNHEQVTTVTLEPAKPPAQK